MISPLVPMLSLLLPERLRWLLSLPLLCLPPREGWRPSWELGPPSSKDIDPSDAYSNGHGTMWIDDLWWCSDSDGSLDCCCDDNDDDCADSEWNLARAIWLGDSVSSTISLKSDGPGVACWRGCAMFDGGNECGCAEASTSSC